MTDKQIIIDEEGKGCAFYANGKCLCSDFCLASYCADAPLCIYKQWLRKEQECEELKAKLELFKTSNQTTIDQLKKENEELKEKIDNIRDFAKQGKDMFIEQDSFADWYKIAEFMKNHFNFILNKINEVIDDKNNN